MHEKQVSLSVLTIVQDMGMGGDIMDDGDIMDGGDITDGGDTTIGDRIFTGEARL
jgi:hypothetical protein